MAQAYDVLLVRHGESESNAIGRFAYHSWDPHLTKKGQAQAARVAQQLKGAPIKHMVSSPLTRAQETIQPLAEITSLKPLILPGLAEVNLGQWDGLNVADLEKAHNGEFEAWRQDPEANPPPGGESILAVGRRVLSSLEQFVTSHDPGLTIAATHSDCIKGAMLVITQSSGPSARTVFIPNCGQLLMRYLPNRCRWVLVLTPLHFPDETFSN